jgi:CheY-like chemotaxis protein
VPRRRILVVDDDVERAQTLGMLVRQLGHDVQVVHDGPAALEAARFHRPHLVLVELTMPEVNGCGVVERLRADPSFAPVQFVAVTGSDREEARRRSRDAGFVQHLVKPVEIERLRKLFERL